MGPHKKERMGRNCYTELNEGMIQIMTPMIQMCSDREVDIMAESNGFKVQARYQKVGKVEGSQMEGVGEYFKEHSASSRARHLGGPVGCQFLKWRLCSPSAVQSCFMPVIHSLPSCMYNVRSTGLRAFAFDIVMPIMLLVPVFPLLCSILSILRLCSRRLP